jgi:hypothetical protein
MNARWKNRLPLLVVAGLLVAALVVMARWQPARAARADAPLTGPRYTVIETEGHNLIVTDNQNNTLYFYTIDKDKEVGSDLHLRGSVDLTQVGKETVKPNNVKLQK